MREVDVLASLLLVMTHKQKLSNTFVIIKEHVNLGYSWALKIYQWYHLGDVSKPACEEYTQLLGRKDTRESVKLNHNHLPLIFLM